MKNLVKSVLAALAVLAAVIAMPRHPSTSPANGGDMTLSLQELEAAAGADRLPVQTLDDRSLVFSAMGTP
ncbi:hypothetical protein [Bradyrhizobium sp. WD16]|uniref:hypothetical protein n=1 Tax=Bradyrhizobium sp. WD16 TaxID=1521768 RepID=UPI0020A46A88|nr:hypothetical protein [Bradyrhizobium sp. WD16]UTD25743.1 hypothetical protein DB459_01280 [Bradyrhizobium sp. WD16]